MHDRQPHFSGQSSERDEAVAKALGMNAREQQSDEQRFLDYLLATGFTQNEAIKLVHQRTHLYENSEMRQRLHDDGRIQFARWLYEHGEITA
ncbi:MAG TPA: hypothetical protein DHW02_11990 [Ktedonobacter sp.]|nr:hypothetical protein [Ktedonobacter sp.]